MPVFYGGTRSRQISQQDVETTISSSLALIEGRTETDCVTMSVRNLSLLVTAARVFVEKDPAMLRRHFRKKHAPRQVSRTDPPSGSATIA